MSAAAWVRDWDDLPEWAPDVFTEAQLTIPSVLRWQLCIRMLHCRASVQHVAIILSTYMTAVDLKAHPSVGALARDTGRKELTVRQALAELVDRGWLQMTRRANASGQQISNAYQGAAPAALTVERHPDTDRPMRLHQQWGDGTCCARGVPNSRGPRAEEQGAPLPKGTPPPAVEDPLGGAEEHPEGSKGFPEDIPEDIPGSSSLSATANGSPKFELGKRYAEHVRKGDLSEDDVAKAAGFMEADDRADFLKGFQDTLPSRAVA